MNFVLKRTRCLTLREFGRTVIEFFSKPVIQAPPVFVWRQGHVFELGHFLGTK